MEQSRTYKAILFKQRTGSPVQAAFVAPSCEVDSWARVPTKKTGNIRNFQRAQMPKHVQEVEKFFVNTANASPTAVVIGFDPIRSQGRVLTVGPSGKSIEDNPIEPGVPVLGEIRITWDEDLDPESEEQLRAAISGASPNLKKLIYAELQDITSLKPEVIDDVLEKVQGSLDGFDVEGDPSPLGPSENGNGGINDVATPQDVEIPQEAKALMPGLSPSEQQLIVNRLRFLAATLEPQLKKHAMATLRDVFAEVRDEMKPAILIDGQHRVLGTRKLGKIPFLVTALPGAEWPELAFQFIVTNRTAKRVPESLLISIVGNSLSQKQRGEIETRLREANIRVGLIEAVMRVHEDEQSPFYRMIAFGLKNEEGFLDAAAMRGKVIQVWYERQAPVHSLFDHVCQGKRRLDRTEYWKDEELWFDYFVAFWSAVRERYENSNVFSTELVPVKGKLEPASKMMSATVLMIFQETVLEHLHTYLQSKQTAENIPIAASLPDEKKFYELVKNTLAPLTPDFFTEWKLSGFDGSIGARNDLADAIKKIIDKKATVAKLKKGQHRLFKEESSAPTD